MKKLLLLFLVLSIVFVYGCTSSSSSSTTTSSSSSSSSTVTPSFAISSTSWSDGGDIPDANAYKNVSGGLNKSPQLTFSNPPPGTTHYAIVMIDQQASTYKHWRVLNIPVATSSINEDASQTGMPADSVQLDSGDAGPVYEGPWPDPGQTHSYVITVYALNATATAAADASNTAVVSALSSIGTATLTGSFTNN